MRSRSYILTALGNDSFVSLTLPYRCLNIFGTEHATWHLFKEISSRLMKYQFGSADIIRRKGLYICQEA